MDRKERVKRAKRIANIMRVVACVLWITSSILLIKGYVMPFIASFWAFFTSLVIIAREEIEAYIWGDHPEHQE
jgi:hypothetical protein